MPRMTVKGTAPTITLYGLPASHPSAAVGRALELKGLAYRRRDRLPVVHKLQHRVLFGQGSAPAVRIGSRRLIGTMEILGALDALRPDPPMFPSGEGALRVVEAARWADVELQGVARRLAWVAMVACPESVASVLQGSELLLPTKLAFALSRPVILIGARLNRATEEHVREDLVALPGMLDWADQLLDDGVVNAEAPNAATLQITASVAVLGCLEDVRPMLANRPIAELASAHFPDYTGYLPAGCVPTA